MSFPISRRAVALGLPALALTGCVTGGGAGLVARDEWRSVPNAEFDQWLAERSPDSGIRDFEDVNALANAAGFSLREDSTMPANNRLLVFSSPEP